MKKSDNDFVNLYTIKTVKSDHTGFWKYYLDETEASQEFWKAFKDNYVEVSIKKERFMMNELPEDIREKLVKIEEQKPMEVPAN